MMGRLLVIGVAVVIGTVLVGWWAVPAIGLVWGFVAHRRHAPGRTAALGATLGWTGLVAWNLVRGEGWQLAARVGDTLGIGGALGYVAATLVFAAVLAGTAAVLGGTIKRVVR